MRCGRDVWPPRPASVTWMRSDAPVIGPSTKADVTYVEPWGRSAARRCARHPSGRHRRAACSAPPGMTSSAGWKIRRTPTGQGLQLVKPRPAPRPRRQDQRCGRRDRRRGRRRARSSAKASDVVSCTGRASRSARSATIGPSFGPMSADQSGTVEPLVGNPVLVHPRRDDVGRAFLVPRELGKGVQIAAQLDEVRSDDLDRAADLLVGHRLRIRARQAPSAVLICSTVSSASFSRDLRASTGARTLTGEREVKDRPVVDLGAAAVGGERQVVCRSGAAVPAATDERSWAWS